MALTCTVGSDDTNEACVSVEMQVNIFKVAPLSYINTSYSQIVLLYAGIDDLISVIVRAWAKTGEDLNRTPRKRAYAMRFNAFRST